MFRSVEKYSTRPLNVAKRMKIVHVGMEFKGVTPAKFMLGTIIRDLAEYQASRGADVRMYLPKPSDVTEGIKTGPCNDITVIGQEEKKLKISLVDIPKTWAGPGTLKVFLLEDEFFFGSYNLYTRKEDWIYPWVVLPLSVMEHLRSTEFAPNIVHCHSWQTGLLPIYIKMQAGVDIDPFLKKIRTVFAPHEYRYLGNFDIKQWKFVGLPGTLLNENSLEYRENICLFKAGMHADLILFDGEDQLKNAISSPEPEGIGEFISRIQENRKIRCAQNYKQDSVTIECGRRVVEAYRELLKGGKYSLDLSRTLVSEVKDDNFPVDGKFKNIEASERELESGNAIIRRLSGKMGEMQDDGRYILPLDVKENCETWGIGLAEGRKNGNIKILGMRLSEITENQSLAIFAQLPKLGLGWILPFKSDTIMNTERIMVGNRPLYEAKYGIVLFALPENVDRDVNLPEMRKLEESGLLMADQDTGETASFIQKPLIDEIIRIARERDKRQVFKCVSPTAIRYDIAKMMEEKYSQKGKDGVPLFEKGLDWERHIIEPMFMTEEMWTKSQQTEGKGKEANLQDRKFTREDWKMLWKIAQEIKQASGGIGVGNLGVNSLILHIDNAYEIHRINFMAASEDLRANHDVRELFGIPVDKDEIDSYLEGVERPQTQGSYLIKNSIFKKGGKVGKNCVIIDSIFEDYIEIPNQTVIIGSHIYQADNSDYLSEYGSLIYNLNMSDEKDGKFKFSKMTAQMSIYKDNEKVNCVHPINIEPHKSNFREKEIVSRKSFGDKIFGDHTFNDLQNEVGLKKTLEIQEDHQNKIKELFPKEQK